MPCNINREYRTNVGETQAQKDQLLFTPKEDEPYLDYMRQKVWKDFYWKVNTSRKEVYL